MEANDVRDSLTERVCEVVTNDEEHKLINMYVIIKICGTLPIVTSDSKVLQSITKETISATADTPASVINFIADKEYENLTLQNTGTAVKRFVFMSRLTSPITGDEIFVVYDRKYEDIIFIPSLASFNIISELELESSKKTFKINGYRLGGGKDIVTNDPGQLLEVDEHSRTKIKLAKGYNSKIKATSVVVSNLDNKNTGRAPTHRKTNGDIGIVYSDQHLNTCINLGKVTDLLEDTSHALPVYLLYKYSVSAYTISYINKVKTGDYDLLVFLPF